MEHDRRILNKDSKSALSDPVRVYSCETIEDFDVDIPQTADTAVDVAL